MSENLHSNLVKSIKNRKSLLWIVKETIDNGGKLSEAFASLADFYWEACWTESISDLFYDLSAEDALKAPRRPERGLMPRQPYRLSAEPDKAGEIDRHSFFPIYEINGSSREEEIDGRSDASSVRRQYFHR
jgi:hypothetical protein